MRRVDETKVLELMTRPREVGIINPISVDEEFTLIAGAHRLVAAENLGWESIEAKIFNEDDLTKKLIEISENSFRNELCYIAQSEHIQERERILGSLGKRRNRGSNQYSDDKDTLTTDELCERIGVPTRSIVMRRQVGELEPELRNALRGTEYARKNLERPTCPTTTIDSRQTRVAELAASDPTQTLRFHIDTANIDINTNRDKSQLVAELKEKWVSQHRS